MRASFSGIDNAALLPDLSSTASEDSNGSHPLHGLSELSEEIGRVDQLQSNIPGTLVGEKSCIRLKHAHVLLEDDVVVAVEFPGAPGIHGYRRRVGEVPAFGLEEGGVGGVE